MSTTLNLQSSATLGTGKPVTHQQRLDEQEDREVKRAMGGRSAPSKRRRRPNTFDAPDIESDPGEDTGSDPQMDIDCQDIEGEGPSRSKPVVVVDSGFSTALRPSTFDDEEPLPQGTQVGGALKRNADGTVVAPRISERKSKSTKAGTIVSVLLHISETRYLSGDCLRALEVPAGQEGRGGFR